VSPAGKKSNNIVVQIPKQALEEAMISYKSKHGQPASVGQAQANKLMSPKGTQIRDLPN